MGSRNQSPDQNRPKKTKTHQIEIMKSLWKCRLFKSGIVNQGRALLHQDAAIKKVPISVSEESAEHVQKTVFASSQEALALTEKIHAEMRNPNQTLDEMSRYYFDGQGKAVRPALTLIMAGACNSHLQAPYSTRIADLQKQIAIICEMFHTSSLLHDDVIDHAETRRGKISVNSKWSQVSSIQAGVYVLSVSTRLLAQTENPDVIESMSQILYDLVNGEFQQMTSRSDKDDRFQLYLDKTFNKTASLMANSCKSVAILVSENHSDKSIIDMAYRYGKNIGIAFQLVDDWLDFVSSADMLGKPSAADLSLGLATAPVLFASEQFPELNKLILRRFSEKGDVETAFRLVMESEGLQQTRLLANKYKEAAMTSIGAMAESGDKEKLAYIAEKVISRMN